MCVKAGVKNAFKKAPDRAMVKARAKAVFKMSIELHPWLMHWSLSLAGLLRICILRMSAM